MPKKIIKKGKKKHKNKPTSKKYAKYKIENGIIKVPNIIEVDNFNLN